MDGEPMSFSTLALILLLAVACIMLACHCLGPRANTWMRTNKEEKIGLSKNKLFHANGYMMHSGSEFLLSNSGSFKRFDTIDREDYRQSGQQPTTQHGTTPLWNLAGEAEVDSNIPPQPLRPAPAPGGTQPPASAGPIKTVTFSFEQMNETTPTSSSSTIHRYAQDQNGRSVAAVDSCMMVSNMRSSLKAANTAIPKPLEAPPPPRLSASSSALSSSAIPRPVAKRQVSLQNGVQMIGGGNGVRIGAIVGTVNNQLETTTIQETEALCTTTAAATKTTNTNLKRLQRRNSSTNPFLCESAESFTESSTALKQQQQQEQTLHTQNTSTTSKNNNNNSNNNNVYNGPSNNGKAYTTICTMPTPTTTKTTATNGSCNPFYSELVPAAEAPAIDTNHTTPQIPLNAKSLQQQFQEFRKRSFSTTESTTEDSELNSLAGGLRRLTQNSTNPFNGLTQRVQKGPHMLQKTISEDFLFRKLGLNANGAQHTAQPANGSTATNGCSSGGASVGGSGGGNTTWTFGRSLMRQDSIISLGRRNSSQSSLDSTICGGSMESINLERAISCDSVNSDSSSSVFVGESDQSYTQITGYLCVGLQYDKNSITNEGLELTVMVLEAKGLICPFNVDSLDTFVRIYLVPDEAAATQTKVFKDSATPCYNESFNFWLKKQHNRHSLWFHLYHNGDAHTLIGEAEMAIDEMPRSVTTWLPLTDSRKCNAQWGELMFSLSYLPTAERLTIVVVKARNLKMEVKGNEDESAMTQRVHSVFVKVYLMNNEKKVLKKRTSLKRRDRCPIFNESVIFSVPPQSLATVQLRLTVYGVVEADDDGGSSGSSSAGGRSNTTRIIPLGHVIAGACATGKGLRHWHQMLSSLRKPVAMWHVLRRASYQPIFTGGAEAVVAALQSTALRAKRNSVI